MRTLCTSILVTLVMTQVPGYLMAEDGSKLANEAKRILTKHCSACHLQEADGGIDYILNVGQLKSQKRIVGGNSAQSKLIKVITQGEMPPQDINPKGSKTPVPPVSAADLSLLKNWIDTGASDFNAKVETSAFITDEMVYEVIRADLQKLDVRTARNTRYFSIVHLLNAGVDRATIQLYEQGLSKLLNSLSWNSRLCRPVVVDTTRTLFRIDLRNYNWQSSTWLTILAANPYGFVRQTQTVQYCCQQTDCPLPVVRADWFVFKASEPALYQSIVGIPKTVHELEDILCVNADENIVRGIAVRAGFAISHVSSNNRIIERHPLHYPGGIEGAYWKSYDFAGNESQDRRNIFEQPLGPGIGKYAFKADGGEMIFNLPNGLQAYMLIDSAGKRLDVGPINIVHDDNARNKLVANGISCMSCHIRGMKDDGKDEIREVYKTNKNNPLSVRELRDLNALYVERAAMDDWINKDRDRFLTALKAIGVDTTSTIEPVRALSKRFEDELGLKLAAAELGLTEDQFLKFMNSSTNISKTLGSLRVGTVKRDLFIREFRNVIEEFNLGRIFSGREVNELRLKDPNTLSPGGTPITTGLTGDGRELVLDLGSKVTLEMVLIQAPSQKFIMGSPKSEMGRRSDEDQVAVDLKYSFFMGKFEVTQQQYEAVVGKFRNESAFHGGNLPVEKVSWQEAIYFCRCLSDKTKRNVRLPNEVEWEFACRAGTSTAFYFGYSISTNDANFDGAPSGVSRQATTAFDKFKANPFGLYGMHDNVSEWCEVYDPNKLELRSETAETQSGKFAVARGGSWYARAENCRSAYREPLTSDTKRSSLGFRIVVAK